MWLLWPAQLRMGLPGSVGNEEIADTHTAKQPSCGLWSLIEMHQQQSWTSARLLHSLKQGGRFSRSQWGGVGVSVEKPSQAVSIWEEEVLVVIFCIHCQRLYSDPGKVLPVPWVGGIWSPWQIPFIRVTLWTSLWGVSLKNNWYEEHNPLCHYWAGGPE